MYVHAYQIDNVLKVFRKQLGRRLKFKGTHYASKDVATEKVNLSEVNQRQTIINQVSADIVKRIAKYSPRSRIEETIKQTLETVKPLEENPGKTSETEFSYTEIDENNHKRTSFFQFNDVQPADGNADQTKKQIVDEQGNSLEEKKE